MGRRKAPGKHRLRRYKMGDIEETNLPTWTKLSGSIVSLFVTKITHACSLLLFQNSSSSWNNYITKAQMVFYCY